MDEWSILSMEITRSGRDRGISLTVGVVNEGNGKVDSVDAGEGAKTGCSEGANVGVSLTSRDAAIISCSTLCKTFMAAVV